MQLVGVSFSPFHGGPPTFAFNIPAPNLILQLANMVLLYLNFFWQVIPLVGVLDFLY